MTVMITKFSVDKTMINWETDANSGTDVLVDSLVHPDNLGTPDKTQLIVEDNIASPVVQSHYPMSGGINAQTLHRNHLEQDTLGNVQADATARGIATGGKTQEELIALIIQDECSKQGVPYLL